MDEITGHGSIYVRNGARNNFMKTIEEIAEYTHQKNSDGFLTTVESIAEGIRNYVSSRPWIPIIEANSDLDFRRNLYKILEGRNDGFYNQLTALKKAAMSYLKHLKNIVDYVDCVEADDWQTKHDKLEKELKKLIK